MRALLLTLLAGSAVAEAADPTETRPHADAVVEPEPPDPDHGFSFLGFLQARTVLTDVVTTNALLDGQLVGQLGGTNGTIAQDEEIAWYAEQRLNGFFTYRPPILDARVAVTAGFEVDFGFGDASYGNTGNRGGGFGADQVNLQTRRLHVDVLALDRPRHALTLRLGQQFLSDGVYDPTVSRPDDLFRTGAGLRFWGSEAAGLTAFGTVSDAHGVRLRYRLGAFTLWELGSGQPDDTTFFVADAQWHPTWDTRLGVHAWYLNDDSGGQGGLLGVGPISQLAEFQGAARLDLREAEGGPQPRLKSDVAWIGVDGGLNHTLTQGPFSANAAVFVNAGRLSTAFPDPDDAEADPTPADPVPVRGVLATGEIRFRYQRGKGSILRLEGLYTTGDDPDTRAYEGVITGNSYGVVGAVYGSHDTVLLHPDIGAINRQVAAVYDVSARGRGLVSGQLGLGYDLVPNRLNLRSTVAHARTASLDPLGTEVNLRLVGEPFLFFEVGLVGAVVLGSEADAMPWTTYGYLQWVVF